MAQNRLGNTGLSYLQSVRIVSWVRYWNGGQLVKSTLSYSTVLLILEYNATGDTTLHFCKFILVYSVYS